MDTTKIHVAVIGAGPAGLAAIKALREEGFRVTCFERRSSPGGVWAFSENPEYTSVTSGTRAQLSKFVSPFSDYPFPDDFPRHPTAPDLAAYYQEYAKHFGLLEWIVFDAVVTSIERCDYGLKWGVTIAGEPEFRVFDKIIMATGSEVTRNEPVIEGRELFKGRFIHGQEYKRPEDFADKNVIVIGQGNSAADCSVELSSHAAKVYWSHRRGAMVFPRMVAGERFDKFANWKMTRWGFVVANRFPGFHRWMFDKFFTMIVTKSWGTLDPKWRLDRTPYYATTISGMVVNDDLIPALRAGQVESIHGVRKVLGPRTVELDDGTVLEDIDAIIACTGYINTLRPISDILNYWQPLPTVRPMPDLYQGIFPICYEDSVACLNYAIVMDTAATCRELSALTVAQVWAGKSKLPPRQEMHRAMDRHHEWFIARCLETELPQYEGLREPAEWLRFVNEMAGTGVYEHLGWTMKGIKFWLREPSLYKMMAWGVNSPHMYRVFETGKRKAWAGAKDAIRNVNRLSEIDLKGGKA